VLAARLRNGRCIVGQSNVSHPDDRGGGLGGGGSVSSGSGSGSGSGLGSGSVNDASASKANAGLAPLESPIARVFYVCAEAGGRAGQGRLGLEKDEGGGGQGGLGSLGSVGAGGAAVSEPSPESVAANARVLGELRRASCIVYAQGSLFTSLLPSLVLRGVGEAVELNSAAPKILVLNGSVDRETSPCLRASDVVQAVCDGLNRYGERRAAASLLVSALVVPNPSPVEVDYENLAALGVGVVHVAATAQNCPGLAGAAARVEYDSDELCRELLRISMISV
jgi:hypothetical protein